MALGNLRDRACTWVVCFVTVLVIASIFVKKTEWSEISLRRPLSPLLSQNRLRVYGGAGEFRANRGKKLNVLVCAKRQGDALGVRALTSMGDILELKAGDWVQYQSNTYDKWLMAKILDVSAIKDTDRQTDREREIDTERDRERHTQRDIERDRERERETERERERDREREREGERHRERQRER
ncbi:hypothetical protein AAMO2058_000621000 [Amorphochlora amoebiformis]